MPAVTICRHCEESIGEHSPDQSDGLAQGFAQQFPGMQITIKTDLSKYHDARIDNQLTRNRLEPDVAHLQTLQDFDLWRHGLADGPLEDGGLLERLGPPGRGAVQVPDRAVPRRTARPQPRRSKRPPPTHHELRPYVHSGHRCRCCARAARVRRPYRLDRRSARDGLRIPDRPAPAPRDRRFGDNPWHPGSARAAVSRRNLRHEDGEPRAAQGHQHRGAATSCLCRDICLCLGR